MNYSSIEIITKICAQLEKAMAEDREFREMMERVRIKDAARRIRKKGGRAGRCANDDAIT